MMNPARFKVRMDEILKGKDISAIKHQALYLIVYAFLTECPGYSDAVETFIKRLESEPTPARRPPVEPIT